MKISIHRRPCDFNGTQYSEGFETIDVTTMGVLAAITTRYVWSPIVWRDGRRLAVNFQYVDMLGIDVDNGINIKYATENLYPDMTGFVGTTRTHLKEKKGLVAERFRIGLALDKRIEHLDHYRQVLKPFIQQCDGDFTGQCGARFFWPSSKIVWAQNEGDLVEAGEFTPPVARPKPTIASKIEKAQGIFKHRGVTGWLRDFLNEGKLPRKAGGRNDACHWAAKELLYLGLDPSAIKNLLIKSPFKKEGFEDREYDSSIASAVKFVQDEMEKEGKLDEKEHRQYLAGWLAQRP